MDLRRHRSLGGLCASITPRYQTATFRPMRAPLLPRYAPSDRMRLRTAANRVRNGRCGDALRSSTWQSLCATPWCWTRRGAALYAMQRLMYRLREDGETFTPAAAVKVARHRLCAAASADYWWIENHHEWLRDGGAKAHPTRTTTRAAWDQKWSGLQRRTPHKAAGHEAANSGAMSDGWLPPEERARHRDSIA